MPNRIVQRSAVLAAGLTFLVSGLASADTVGADGDAVTPGNQTFIDLGETGPGGVVSFDVDFTLVCRNGAHPAHGSTIAVDLGSSSIPDASSIAVEPGSIGPIPDSWPVTGELCFGSPTLVSSTPARVTITAPTAIGDDFLFTLIFSRSPLDGITGSTAVTAQIDVVGNTPPVIDVPGSFTVEGDTQGGWTADFDVTASDVEDEPDPTPVCTAAQGDVLPLGPTTVSCSVTDSGGLGDTGSFVVTVVDTTAPTLAGVPGDRTVTTADDDAVVTWAAPTATDIVDGSPTVGCSPVSGSTFPVGTTTVTCTATDDSDNSATATFAVAVVRAESVFDQPVGNGGTFTISSSRTIPIKARLFHDGTEMTTGEAWIWLGRCGEAATRVGELERQGGRWMGHLDTSGLGAGCYAVTIRGGGHTFGGFELRIEGDSTAKQSKPKKKS